ncbi:MAG: hypothetical protein ACHQYQ_01160 [Bacteriovoracales bacterium]
MIFLKKFFFFSLIFTNLFCNPSFSNTHFPSSLDPIPKDYKGPVFQISDEFPQEIQSEKDIKNWEKFNPISSPQDYAKNIKEYCLEGQIESNWNGFGNKIRKWYNMPWLHTGNDGREFVWGLTKEPGKIKPFLFPYGDSAQVWALTLFNPIAGYTLGEVWKNPSSSKMNNIVFRNGAIIFKLIFTTLTPKELPYLEGTLKISANITSFNQDTFKNPDHPRKIQDLYLVQMDISVKDSRLKNYVGWAMTSFVYNKKNPGKKFLEKLRLVGLQWGNDPLVTIKKYSQGEKIKESYITKFGEGMIKETSYNGRLNGLANESKNSCMSCHAFSQYHPILPLHFDLLSELLFSKSKNRDKFFQNIPSGTPYTKDYFSADYNFQLFFGLSNYFLNHDIEKLNVSHSEKVRRSNKYEKIIAEIKRSTCLKDVFNEKCKKRINFFMQVHIDPHLFVRLKNWRGVSVGQ